MNEVEDVIHLFLINNIHFSKNKIEYLFGYFGPELMWYTIDYFDDDGVVKQGSNSSWESKVSNL